jgi:hypothetical protein
MPGFELTEAAAKASVLIERLQTIGRQQFETSNVGTGCQL